MSRNMPSREAIASAWDKDANSCWACGDGFNLQRCHIRSKKNGGSDAPQNLTILCASCHAKSEHIHEDVFPTWLDTHFEAYGKHHIQHSIERISSAGINVSDFEGLYNRNGAAAAAIAILGNLYR